MISLHIPTSPLFGAIHSVRNGSIGDLDALTSAYGSAIGTVDAISVIGGITTIGTAVYEWLDDDNDACTENNKLSGQHRL